MFRTKKHWRVILVKSESTALRQFKVTPVLKMNATFQKQCDVKQGMFNLQNATSSSILKKFLQTP